MRIHKLALSGAACMLAVSLMAQAQTNRAATSTD